MNRSTLGFPGRPAAGRRHRDARTNRAAARDRARWPRLRRGRLPRRGLQPAKLTPEPSAWLSPPRPQPVRRTPPASGAAWSSPPAWSPGSPSSRRSRSPTWSAAPRASSASSATLPRASASLDRDRVRLEVDVAVQWPCPVEEVAAQVRRRRGRDRPADRAAGRSTRSPCTPSPPAARPELPEEGPVSTSTRARVAPPAPRALPAAAWVGAAVAVLLVALGVVAGQDALARWGVPAVGASWLGATLDGLDGLRRPPGPCPSGSPWWSSASGPGRGPQAAPPHPRAGRGGRGPLAVARRAVRPRPRRRRGGAGRPGLRRATRTTVRVRAAADRPEEIAGPLEEAMRPVSPARR